MSDDAQLWEKLQAVLEGDFAEIRELARLFLTQPEFQLPQPGITTAEYREITHGWVKKLGESGFARLSFNGGDTRAALNFIEVLCHHDLSFMVKQGVNFGLFGLGVQNLGTEKHHKKYMERIMSGDLLGGFAMTEVGGGSDVQNIQTEAVYDHETRTFTINTPTAAARKAYIGNAAQHGEMMIVFAQLKMSEGAASEGVHAFLVPIRSEPGGKALPGITIEDCDEKDGLHGVDNAYMHYNHVRVPYEAMLDRFAQIDEEGHYQSKIESKTGRFFKMIGTLVTGRVAVAIGSLSAAKSALATAVTYADTREVFKTPLLDMQRTQTRLFSLLAEVYALHCATRRLIDEHADNAPDLETNAAALKAKSSDAAFHTIDEASLVNGGAGYMAGSRYGRLLNDMKVFRTFEGDNTVLRLLVARNRLNEVRRHFSNVSGIGKKRKMLARGFGNAASKFGVIKGPVRRSRLLDPEFQMGTFARREKAMLYGLTRKIAKGAKKPGGAQLAADKSQDDMIAYANAYAERVMFEQFSRAVREQQDPETRAILKLVCDVFAVNTIKRNGEWSLKSGFMSPKRARAFAQALHEELRPHAVALVEAFAIPKEFLSVPKPEAAAVPVSGRRAGARMRP